MNSATRMLLRAYIHEDGSVIDHHDLGTVTIHDIFLLRPDRCRFAIAREGIVFLCIDMYDCDVARLKVMSCRHRKFDTLEAAMMAATLSLA